MFTITNLVDRNLGDNLQVINLDDMTMTETIRNDNDITNVAKYDLKKIYLVEPQRGRIFLTGDAIVPGMSFKKIIPGPSGPVSEIICPYGKSISYYYSIQ